MAQEVAEAVGPRSADPRGAACHYGTVATNAGGNGVVQFDDASRCSAWRWCFRPMAGARHAATHGQEQHRYTTSSRWFIGSEGTRRDHARAVVPASVLICALLMALVVWRA